MDSNKPHGSSYEVDNLLTKLKKSADPEAALWEPEDFLRASKHTQNSFLHGDSSYERKEAVARYLYVELFPQSELTYATDPPGRQKCWEVTENIHGLYEQLEQG